MSVREAIIIVVVQSTLQCVRPDSYHSRILRTGTCRAKRREFQQPGSRSLQLITDLENPRKSNAAKIVGLVSATMGLLERRSRPTTLEPSPASGIIVAHGDHRAGKTCGAPWTFSP
eukprot:scaffold53217_cov52-Attheya_sp.AAC.4